MPSTVRPPVVVGIDDSTAAWQALERAAREAAVRKLPLQVVHVATDASAADVQAVLDQARARLRDVLPSDEVTLSAPTGPPVEALLVAGRDATFLALGSRGSGGFRGMLMGSVSAAVARHATFPVLVVRDSADKIPHRSPRVVVGVDGSARAEQAVGFALDQASRWGLPLDVVYVRPTNYESEVESDEGAGLLLAETVAGWREKYPDVVVSTQVLEGHPAQELVRISADADLLVVAARGLGGFPGLTLGSVSHVVLLHAYCDVAIIH